ncbi:hypothetical protein EDD76_11426 [Kineothrix alysoides]|uniref:Uncharacterized protein n=1 Tax=Kineothrix alysoides TaxID=1469948 RepID=A0A4R1QP92_9FIRM|nr:hypothetical protein EDD76_11426 [Kineothrix alysoides]
MKTRYHNWQQMVNVQIVIHLSQIIPAHCVLGRDKKNAGGGFSQFAPMLINGILT